MAASSGTLADRLGGHVTEEEVEEEIGGFGGAGGFGGGGLGTLRSQQSSEYNYTPRDLDDQSQMEEEGLYYGGGRYEYEPPPSLQRVGTW